MATEEEIAAEVEQLGRLSNDAEQILYNIALRQDELGREPTNILLEMMEANPVYKPMIDRELLTYEVFGGGPRPICSLYVTLKGMRYCIMYGDDICAKRKINAAGALKEFQ